MTLPEHASLGMTRNDCLQNYTEGVTYANVPYPKEALAALANSNEDFPGSC